MRMSELKRKEVINVCDCRRLGFVGAMYGPDKGPDRSGTWLRLRLPGPGKGICDPL